MNKRDLSILRPFYAIYAVKGELNSEYFLLFCCTNSLWVLLNRATMICSLTKIEISVSGKQGT